MNDNSLNYQLTEATIQLHDLTFHAHHGVLPEERLLGNTFIVDLTLEADITHAIATDELSGTINYAEAYEVVKQEMGTPSQLLEHVCGRICTALFNRFDALTRVCVSVTKKNPPIEGAGNCSSSVTLTFAR